MRKAVALLCVLSAFPILGRAQSISHEEAYVREAYARLTYLTQMYAVTDKALGTMVPSAVTPAKLDAEVTARQALFTLSNFRVGKLSEIAAVPWGEEVTPAAKLDAVLLTSINRQYYTSPEADPQDWYDATSRWTNPNYDAFAQSSSWYNKSVTEIMGLPGSDFLVQNGSFTRYASFNIQIAFQNRVIGPYKALFLFGKTTKGQEIVSVQDPGNQSLSWDEVMHIRLYPDGLVKTRLREFPTITAWLLANSIAGSDCPPGKKDFCCLPSRCGLPVGEVQADLNAPLSKTQGNPTSEK